MYKKFLNLTINSEDTPLCYVLYQSTGSEIEIKIFYQNELLDLSHQVFRIQVQDEKLLFKSVEALVEKSGRILVTLNPNFTEFDVRHYCEVVIDEIGVAKFYIVILDPSDERQQSPLATDLKVQRQVPQVRMIAHRGLSSLAPENTLPAYSLAGKYGYYGGECDIHETKDGEFIIFHNDLLDKRTTGHGKIKNQLLSELKELEIKEGKQIEKYPQLMLPTLQEYLMVCKKFKLVPVIEVKEMHPKTVQSFLDVLKQWGLFEIIIISFSKEIITEIRQLDAHLQLQWITDLTHENIDYCAKYSLDIDSRHTSVSKDGIDYAHQKGVLVNTWTVDDPTKMQELIEMGVDFITTNQLLFWQTFQSSGKVKSYFLNHKINYTMHLKPNLDDENQEWAFDEESQILSMMSKDNERWLQIKLQAVSEGDVVCASFFANGAFILCLEKVDEKGKRESVQTLEVSTTGWQAIYQQFLILSAANGHDEYYQVIIKRIDKSAIPLLLREVRIKIDYM